MHGHGHSFSRDKKASGRSPHGKILGTTTVGERGQIVIPAEARAEYGISSGDKLVVFSNPHTNSVTLVKAEVFDRYAEFFMSKSKKLERIAEEILGAIKDTGEAEKWEQEAEDGAKEAVEADTAAETDAAEAASAGREPRSPDDTSTSQPSPKEV